MNTIPLTSVITSLFTLFYLFLSMRIGYLRGSPVMKLIFNMDKKVPENKNTLNEVKDFPASLVGKFNAIAGWVKEITIDDKI